MATATLTARGVAGLTTDQPQETFWDELLPGFGLRVSGKTGSKTYLVRYRHQGRHRREKIGRHPVLSLAEAREKAREILRDAQAGGDPALERRQRRRGGFTFETRREVLDAKAGRTKASTRKERERIFNNVLVPAWRGRPAASIARRDVLQLVEAIRDRGAGTSANRTLRLIQLIFNEGLRRDFPTLEANPAHMMALPAEEKSRDRYLTLEEVRVVWKALEPENPFTGTLFRLALLTVQRMGDVAALRWSDINDADVWTIPPEVFKGKRKHMVPLSRPALAALKQLQELKSGDFVFPSRADAESPHMTSWGPALRRIRGRTTNIPHWVAHDFRTTFRTHAGRPIEPDHPKDPTGLGVLPEIADAVLGHKEASIGFAHYQGEPERYLLSEKRDALRRWGAWLEETLIRR